MRREEFKYNLMSFDGNFELNDVVVLLTDISARHSFMKSKMTFVLYKASYDWNAVFN